MVVLAPTGRCREEKIDRAGLKTHEDTMRLSDLIELFVDREESAHAPREADRGRELGDTSSLADIARILRELDGHYEPDRERH
jgi:hypothetical protein